MLLACLPALLAAACMPAERPLPVLARIRLAPGWIEQASPAGVLPARWWREFQDPALDRYVNRALANNTDVLTAIARVDEARGNLSLARAALRPMVDTDASVSRSRSLGDFGVTTSNAIQPEATLSWQLDLFGRLRAQRRAARYQFLASQADRDGVALSVENSIAQSYFTLLALDAQLVVTRETAQTRQVSLRLAQDQAQAGYASQYELTQAQSEYEAVNGQIPELLRGIRKAENALTLLTGEAPAALVVRGNLLTVRTPDVPTTLPSTLLRRRPDLASAERLLAASSASLVAQRAAFLPSVSISASLGQLFVNALNYDPVTIWSLGGSILAPIFEGGRLRANVDVATAQRDEAAYAYRGAVLSAFRDVENALTDVRRYGEQIVIVRRRREILLRSLALATDRYRGGYASYLDQLDAQRSLYSTELEAIGIRQSQLQAIVQLNAAFGGGWQADTSKTED
jgi:NodT family efflux transporter outer membrane factor (OMF) lipoprotein